jgi:hypothetical protein
MSSSDPNTYDAGNELVTSQSVSGVITNTYSSFAATKDFDKTTLCDLITSDHRAEQRHEFVSREVRGQDQRNCRVLRPGDLAGSSAHGRCGVFLDMDVLQANFPQSAAA